MVASSAFDFNKNKKPQQGFTGMPVAISRPSGRPISETINPYINPSAIGLDQNPYIGERYKIDYSAMNRGLFAGEYQSPFTSIKSEGWTWSDGKLVQKPEIGRNQFMLQKQPRQEPKRPQQPQAPQMPPPQRTESIAPSFGGQDEEDNTISGMYKKYRGT
jgi:hypothetical protein